MRWHRLASLKGAILDELDRKILSILVKNARAPVGVISRTLNVPNSTVLYRVKQMEKSGVVRAYIPLIDPRKAGLTITAVILIDVEPGQMKSVAENITQLKSVTQLYEAVGYYGLMAVLMAKDLEELSNILNDKIAKTPGVRNMETLILTKEYKNIPIPEDFP
jgi:Lrp/AsnC family transcriptional regulator for asnA, asnC and gidA